MTVVSIRPYEFGPRTTTRIAECHPDKPHLALGLCKTCYHRKWYQLNLDSARQHNRESNARMRQSPQPAICHPEKRNYRRGLCWTCYFSKYPEARCNKEGRSRRNYIKNREKILARGKLSSYKLKLEVIEAYGGKCACCSTSNQEFLAIDHINGNGAEHRKSVGVSTVFWRWLKKNGFPKDEFRLLCFNCNWSNGIYGYCPHERMR